MVCWKPLEIKQNTFEVRINFKFITVPKVPQKQKTFEVRLNFKFTAVPKVPQKQKILKT